MRKPAGTFPGNFPASFPIPDFNLLLMDKTLNEGKWVEAFKPGTYTDSSGEKRTFSAEDINAIAEGVKGQFAAGYNPPLVKGHPTTDSPRQATIVDVKVGDKNMLMFKVEKVNSDFAEETRKGMWPYQSIALHKDFSKGIRHLGALGGVAPAVKGLQPLEFGEESKDIIYFSTETDIKWAIKDIGSLLRKMREKLIEEEGVEKADAVYPEWTIKNLEDFDISTPTASQGETSNFAEGGSVEQKNEQCVSDEVKKAQEASEKEVEALRAELEAIKAEKAKAEAEARKNAFAEKLGALSKSGKLRAPQIAQAKEIYELIGGGSLSFAEGDREKATDALVALLNDIEPVVKLGGFQFSEGGTEANGAKNAAEKIQKIVKEDGLTYVQACEKLTREKA